MSPIPDDVIRAILEAVDLAELVGRHVPLKRAGKSWKGCCPFHQEKTPSYHVSPEKRMWKCFGCGKGGDAFAFLMEREGLSFPEAVRRLATEVGIAIPEDTDPVAVERAARLERLRAVMERACVFYEKALRTPEGEVARKYLERRGITDGSIGKFRLGYAPPGWRNLLEAAQKAGVTKEDLVDAGLARRKESEDGRPAWVFDKFHERVTFPICDTQGRVVAFGARALGDDEPKYLNSPETPLFSKGRTVYALHLARQDMAKSGECAMMEGYTDVIMAHQHGWPVAVAGLGTALTRDQASLIAERVKRVYLVYDGDDAGRRAAERNTAVFLAEDVQTRVALLPDGEDPCDLLLRAGLPGLRSCLTGSRDALEFLIDSKAVGSDMNSVSGQASALEATLAALAPVKNDVRRTLYLRRVARRFGIDAGVLDQTVRELRLRLPSAAVARPRESRR